ncbi:MAG: hypothetical protein AABX79_03285 [Nanoarchaeota archaeon]
MNLASILKRKKKGKTLALSQAFSIILSTIAFAYVIASAFPVVGAQTSGICVYSKESSKSPQTIELPVGMTVTEYCEPYIKGGWPCYQISCTQIEIPSNLPTNPRNDYSSLTPQPAASTPNPAAGLSQIASTGASLAAGGKGAAGGGAPPLYGVSPGDTFPAGNSPLMKSDGTPVNAAGTAKVGGFLGKTAIPGFKGYSLTIGELLGTVAWAASIYAGMKIITGLFGASPELSNALSAGASVGFLAAKISSQLGLSKLIGTKLFGMVANFGWVTFGIGFAVAALVFIFTFKQTRYDLVAFTCSQWEAPIGGKYCVECNKGDFPCTEYSCRSLGQACELENAGTTEELCVWKNPRDVTPPIIQPWTETLTTGYEYIPDNTVSPPDKGVKIVPENNNNGCVAPFTPIRFGVTLNEAAKCKADFSNKGNFDEMSFFFGGSSTSKYNHSQTISLPSPQALATENITLENSGQFTIYSRCQDANGNSNTANFVFKFCLDEGPDTTPPLIVTTSILNGFPIAFGQTSVDLQAFVNEPAECKWSRIDKNYDEMENQMSCNTNVLEFNSQMLYECSTTLTGLNDGVKNEFYFRCLDQPELKGTANESDRNVNTQSYKFTLVGTRSLVIDSVKPNGTIKDSTDIVKVTLEAETSAGFSEGMALCFFSETGDEGSFVEFFNTGTNKHSQDLYLPEGDYTYYIRCTDLGGNTDNKATSFSVESDSDAPIVVRVFREENFLKVITDEKSSCVYSTSSGNACSYLFEDGIAMKSLEDNNKHQIAWDPDKTFYIKCEDEFGNQPLPNECSIIARPFGK